MQYHWHPVLTTAVELYVECAGPLVQFKGAVPTVEQYMPTGHSTQVDEATAPTAVEYVPTAHDRHVDDPLAPTVGEYVPARQNWHTDDVVWIGPYVPALHLQSVTADADELRVFELRGHVCSNVIEMLVPLRPAEHTENPASC